MAPVQGWQANSWSVPYFSVSFLVAQTVKNLPAVMETWVRSLGQVGKIPWRREWQPTPVFLPGKSHGQRSLEGYSSWGRKESVTTKLSMHIFPFSSNFAVLPCSPHSLILSTILWQWFSNYICHIHKTTSCLSWVRLTLSNFFPF